MKSDGEYIWKYYSGKCECSDCGNCPHYRPDYKEKEDVVMKYGLW